MKPDTALIVGVLRGQGAASLNLVEVVREEVEGVAAGVEGLAAGVHSLQQEAFAASQATRKQNHTALCAANYWCESPSTANLVSHRQRECAGKDAEIRVLKAEIRALQALDLAKPRTHQKASRPQQNLGI